jgi:hypothetical protein
MSFQIGEIYITAPQLRERFGGRSDVWLWRLLNDIEPISRDRVGSPLPLLADVGNLSLGRS